jgi:hypothetical protein
VPQQNYQHGKRQRELAKKQKREEKLQRKLERKNNPGAQGQDDVAETPEPDTDLDTDTEGEP